MRGIRSRKLGDLTDTNQIYLYHSTINRPGQSFNKRPCTVWIMVGVYNYRPFIFINPQVKL